MATGTTSVAAIYTRDLLTLPVVVPPAKEQEAIAAALSDADGMVAGLEQVIAKKRLIKQGAMQDLLTARRRLPGFSGLLVPGSVLSPSRITPENNGKFRAHRDRENAFARASGGVNATAVEPSLGRKSLILL